MPTDAAGDFECEVFEDRAGAVEQHGSSEQRHAEAKRLEECAEGAVQLEAPAAPACVDDLAERRAAVVGDAGREHDVEVLERHRREMRVLEQRQAVEVGADRAASHAEPGQVPVDVDIGPAR